MIIVSVIESRSMPGRYEVSLIAPGKQRKHVADTRDAGNAAALAIRATGTIRDRYSIVGPDVVLSLIPHEVRTGGGQ